MTTVRNVCGGPGVVVTVVVTLDVVVAVVVVPTPDLLELMHPAASSAVTAARTATFTV
jgi:hypothetical protein